jgi:hypothetical protein
MKLCTKQCCFLEACCELFQQIWMEISLITQEHTVIYCCNILLLIITLPTLLMYVIIEQEALAIFFYKGISVCHISHHKKLFLI